MAAKTFSIKYAGFPMESVRKLAEMLTGKATFKRWDAIYAAMDIVTYLMQFAAESYAVKSIKAAKVSKKSVALALQKILDSKEKSVAVSFDIPVWLLPILVKLIIKWIENTYPSEGK